MGYGLLLPLGRFVVGNLLVRKAERDDKLTWRVWNLWMMSVYLLPFFRSLG